MPGRMEARVKSVVSGDTLVLESVNNRGQERTFSFAYVSAPRLRREGDEPFAFQSRDFLRKLLVGKVVQFQILYNIPTGVKRDYGLVFTAANQRLPDVLVAEGWAKLRDDAGKKDDSEDSKELIEKLEALEAHAKADAKGLWGKEGKDLESVYELPNPKAFLEEHKGQSLDAIVEKVVSGDRLIVRFLINPKLHIQTLILVAGIRAPSTKRVNPSDSSETAAEPFGPEAQEFVESRLLQRSVGVTVLGVTPHDQLFGSVKHPNGSIAEFLLKAGLARCTDFHSTVLGSEMGALRQAERYAKDNKLGVFRGHVSHRQGGAGEMEVTVSRIWSADSISLRTKAGSEKRVFLSSIRQPKQSDPKQAPFVAEAKEFLRKRIIGKHVKVAIDGKRAANEGYEEREMATVSHNNKNVALMLVENGYASVIRHRMDDPDRSPVYDELLGAEEAAQSDGKGMWNPKPPKAIQYVDYSESLEKAKRQMSLLARQKKVPAVVDYVRSGSRFVVLIPRDNAKLTFVLGGIRCPRTARNANETSEPFGQEAADFANRRCLQRDVEIDVDDTDKVGGFVGTLYVNRENFAKLLVEEGLASVHAYSAERSGNANELNAAEQKAKEARRGMWHDWDPSKEAAENGDVDGDYAANSNGTNGDAVPTEKKKDYRDVMVTHVEETGKLKLQMIGPGTANLTELMNSFRSFHLNSANNQQLPGPPKAGDFVAAQFTEDGEWYRARIRRNDRDAKQAEVYYIDYGNAETIPYSRLRPLSQPQFSPQKLRPQAVDAVLSFLQLPTASEYLKDAIYFIEEQTAGKQLIANVDHSPSDGPIHVTLIEQSAKSLTASFNADVVSEGLAMVPRKLKAWQRAYDDVLDALRKKEAVAKEERKGINLAFASLLLSKNCNVLFADISLRPEAQEVVDSHASESEGKGRAVFQKTNVVDWDQLTAMFEAADKEFAGVDIVCPGAGVFEPHWSNFWHLPGACPSAQDSPHGTDGIGHYATLDINITHPIRTTQLAIAAWLNPTHGAKASPTNPKRIVHISSIAGQTAVFTVPLYVASKWAISGFIRSLESLEPATGIRVNGVAPGLIKTPLWTDHPEKLAFVGEDDTWATAEEVADAMLRCVEDDGVGAGQLLEVGHGQTRKVMMFNDPGPRGSGHEVSWMGKGYEEVYGWLSEEGWGKVRGRKASWGNY